MNNKETVCANVVCSMRPEIEAMHRAICGSVDGATSGLAEQLRAVKGALETHVRDAEEREARLARLEREWDGNGTPGARMDIRQIKRGVTVLRWAGAIVVAGLLANFGSELWGKLKRGWDWDDRQPSAAAETVGPAETGRRVGR